MFESIPSAPPDAILGLTVAFQKDPSPAKVNLGVGVYKDETGATPILASVKLAERKIVESAKTKSYMPIGGDPAYGKLVQDMILGEGHEAIQSARVRTAHTPGGTGGLRVGADFLKKFFGTSTVWISKPTWANHRGIFQAAGFKVEEYPYYDPKTKGLDFAAMKAGLANVRAGDIVLLHVCCHNPTGVDLTKEQWNEIAEIGGKQGWIPFLDFAYQGFGESVEADRHGVLAMAAKCPEMIVSSSFSKNFGLYQDRTGALTLFARNAAQADACFSNIEIVVRVNYSNPAAHGGLIVTTILSDAALKTQWLGELDAMRNRIATVRAELVAALKTSGIAQDFSFIQRQKGMFSFSGLTDAQVAFLKEKKAVYVVGGGRINVAGILPKNLDYLCASIKEALTVS
jgi:aspartate aminotransferase/aromatic-amino-acid transaminase